MAMLSSLDFWIAVGQFITIDVLLGGDNAVVIALACHKLPPKQRAQGVLWGTAGAIVMRIVLIFFALTILSLPFVKIVGAALLLWIGIKLLMPEQEYRHGHIQSGERLWDAVRTMILADLVMSLDNVIAIAGAAEASGAGGSMVPVVIGVLFSVPMIIWGSRLVIRLIDRFPIIITLGGMLLGWIAGAMLITDPAFTNPSALPDLPSSVPSHVARYAAGIAGALVVLMIGRMLTARRTRRAEPTAAAAPVHAGQLRRFLLAVDGSEVSVRATRQVIDMRRDLADPAGLDLLLLNAQRPVSGDVSSFISKQALDDYHQQQGNEALAPARKLLDAAGVRYRAHVRVGNPAEIIANEATAQACDLIVMGTKGTGAAATLLGSVVQSTIEAADVPVLLVK